MVKSWTHELFCIQKNRQFFRRNKNFQKISVFTCHIDKKSIINLPKLSAKSSRHFVISLEYCAKQTVWRSSVWKKNFIIIDFSIFCESLAKTSTKKMKTNLLIRQVFMFRQKNSYPVLQHNERICEEKSERSTIFSNFSIRIYQKVDKINIDGSFDTPFCVLSCGKSVK